MTTDSSFAQHIQRFATWRESAAGNLHTLRGWLSEQKLANEADLSRIDQLLTQLQDSKLRVAFVAEFSRGKSELINAMFFARFGERMLPSGVGTTTQCPTELHYNAAEAPCIKLLPIETRETHAPLSSFAEHPDMWTSIALQLDSPQQMIAAFAHLTETRAVRVSHAMTYGLYNPEQDQNLIAADGTLRIPRWRHAIINVPHPLLELGLVIIDTPGLNAIGTEPELTINLIPETHAVVFVLGIDTGVTKSDLEIWNQCVRATGARERVALVALNKIDGLWDDARGDREDEIQRQIASCAQVLNLPADQVFPISAKKALNARTRGDATMLERSRLPQLETALGSRLIPARHHALRAELESALEALLTNVQRGLNGSLEDCREHLGQLRALRGKNEQLATTLARAVNAENQTMELVRNRTTQVKKVVAAKVDQILPQIDAAGVRDRIGRARASLIASSFSFKMHDTIDQLFSTLGKELTDAGHSLTRMHDLVHAQCELFAADFKVRIAPPVRFPLEHYFNALDRLKGQYELQFRSVLALLLNRKSTLVSKVFEALAARIDSIYQSLNRDVREWLKALIAPLNALQKEREARLAHRVDSMKRLVGSSGDLEARITELERSEAETTSCLTKLTYLAGITRSSVISDGKAAGAKRSSGVVG